MKFRVFLISLLSLVPFAARAIDYAEERKFPVKAGCALKVDLYRGAIDIQETDGAEIVVVAHTTIAAATEEAAAPVRALLGFEARQEGNLVIVHANDSSGRGVQFRWKEQPPVDLECKILVPRRCQVDLRTRDGAITVGNITGRVVVRASKGNLFLRRIEGSIDVATMEGDVIISRCSGEVVAKTEKGVIRAGTLGGHAVLKNAGGDIEVLAAEAGIDVVAEVGDVTVGFPNDFRGDANVRTAYGSIFAKIDPKANCLIQASSFWGHVESRLPLAIEAGGTGKAKLAGRLNDGGPLVTLRANGGHVFLQRGDTYFD